MSRWYRVLASLGVCLPTWVAMTYVSIPIGLFIGLFLMTFCVITMISVQSQKMAAHYTALTASLTGMEGMVLNTNTMLEANLKALPKTATPAGDLAVRFEHTAGDLDALIELVDHILRDPANTAPAEQSRQAMTAML